MPPITALLHTENDALRLGRCLETLYPCDHILIVDHGSRDRTLYIAREYGARVVVAVPGASPDQYARSVAPGWTLNLEPRESLTESLAASLFEWKSELQIDREAALTHSTSPAFSILLREETPGGWIDVPVTQTRLVPHNWNRWNGMLPVHEPSAIALEGELLRFTFP